MNKKNYSLTCHACKQMFTDENAKILCYRNVSFGIVLRAQIYPTVGTVSCRAKRGKTHMIL